MDLAETGMGGSCYLALFLILLDGPLVCPSRAFMFSLLATRHLYWAGLLPFLLLLMLPLPRPLRMPEEQYAREHKEALSPNKEK